MDEDQRFKPAASTKPASTPLLEWAVDKFVEKFEHVCVFHFL